MHASKLRASVHNTYRNVSRLHGPAVLPQQGKCHRAPLQLLLNRRKIGRRARLGIRFRADL
jgi:hypothetical protein